MTIPSKPTRSSRPATPLNTPSAATSPDPKLALVDQLQAPAIDPAKLNSTKVTDLMTQTGLL
ncbi:MAG: hypothetical protein NVSMB43_26340 [Pseudarthrobacter sp.]